MGKTSVLDCTLRDGGYINNWNFGRKTIRGIIAKLVASGVDIIECGFLRDAPYDADRSVFSCVTQLEAFIMPKQPGLLYVAMIALGDIAPEKLLPCDGKTLDGIRLTFHKHEWETAKAATAVLMGKGYKVFVQPVGTTSYSDTELLRLIEDVNMLHPYAFYLVDTLGILYRNELLRLFYLIDRNLETGIKIGFHSHNNLQLSFANAQELMRMESKRDIILDASVYGMGRGVGNLSTELMVEYINVNMERRYSLMPLLSIADQYLMRIFSEQRWGYALPYFLSAVEKCHPNYASHLLRKETLNIEDISKILSLLPANKRDLYHPELIEQLYISMQSFQVDDTQTRCTLEKKLRGKKILLLAPGATLKRCYADIQRYISEHEPYVVSVNFVPEHLHTDILFISNRKRLRVLMDAIQGLGCVIATSNLLSELPESISFINYADYLGEGAAADNAGAMLIRLLTRIGVSHIALAGFDGFDVDSESNYYFDSYKRAMERKTAEQKNADIQRQMKLALQNVPYRVLTPTRYVTLTEKRL